MQAKKCKYLRVCHIISGDLWAGAEVMAYNLLSNLHTQKDIQIYAILLNSGVLSEELKKTGIEVIVIEEKYNSFPSIVWKISSILKKNNFNIIHAHRYKENLIAFCLKILYRNIKTLSTVHGMPEIIGSKKSLKHFFINSLNFQLLKRFFDRTIPVSFETAQILSQDYHFPQPKIYTVHNGIKFSVHISSNQSNENLFTIGTAGRLFPIKNYSFLIDIAAKLRDTNIIFKIAGDGPDRKMLAEKCNSLNLQDKVILVGNVENMFEFYSSLDAYINTSLHEGIPMTILEAMNHALPVIAPKVGGIPEIINHEENGFLCPSGDVVTFAKYCKMLSQNKELYQIMSVNARKRVEQSFSIQACAEKYLNVYSELVNK